MTEGPTQQHASNSSPIEASVKNYVRTSWHLSDPSLDVFFQRFIPLQYNEGFCWRCKNIEGEESRALAFDKHSDRIKTIIAGNAEVLLELFQETSPNDLDRMRIIGTKILSDGVEIDKVNDAKLNEAMSRRHHQKWYDQFTKDLDAGKRSDRDHRGYKPWDELPDIERQVSKIQTLANWRVLAALSDADYQLIRNLSDIQYLAQEKASCANDTILGISVFNYSEISVFQFAEDTELMLKEVNIWAQKLVDKVDTVLVFLKLDDSRKNASQAFILSRQIGVAYDSELEDEVSELDIRLSTKLQHIDCEVSNVPSLIKDIAVYLSFLNKEGIGLDLGTDLGMHEMRFIAVQIK